MEWSDVLKELAKSSPYGVVCLFFTILLDRAYKKNMDALKELHEKTIDDVKDVYKKVYAAIERRNKTTR